jgi:hypothetical protein
LVGDVFCDTVTGKAYTCLNPLAVDFDKMNPSTEEGRALLGFPTVWKEMEAKAFDRKIFIQKDISHNNEPYKCQNWATVTDQKFSGTYHFETGKSICEGDRVLQCKSTSENCEKTKPSTDKSGIWQLTMFKGEPYTTEEMKKMALTIKNGFYWTEGYPFIKGDIVVDPIYSEKIVWTCINSYRCTLVEPSLEAIEDIENTWSF